MFFATERFYLLASFPSVTLRPGVKVSNLQILSSFLVNSANQVVKRDRDRRTEAGSLVSAPDWGGGESVLFVLFFSVLCYIKNIHTF